jgi:hypothetical protein
MVATPGVLELASTQFAAAGYFHADIQGRGQQNFSASFGGGSVFTASPQFYAVNSASLVGSGSFAALVSVKPPASAAFGGSGSITVSVTNSMAGAASAFGSGTIAATADVTAPSAVSFSASGRLAATAQLAASDTAAYTGGGTLSAQFAQQDAASVSFAGSGTIAASVSQRFVTNPAAFGGSGNLQWSQAGIVLAAGNYPASGTLSADGYVFVPRSAAFAGAGKVAATALYGVAGFAACNASGSFNCSLPALDAAGFGIFDATGSLSATLIAEAVVTSVSLGLDPELGGAGELTAAAGVAQVIGYASSFVATGKFHAVASIDPGAKPDNASFASAGGFSAVAFPVRLLTLSQEIRFDYVE